MLVRLQEVFSPSDLCCCIKCPCMHEAVRNRALIAFGRIILQPGYIPATKTSGRRRLVLCSTTRPSTENTREVAPSELLVICGWVKVIVSLAHRSYSGLVKTAMISRLLYTNLILVTLEVSLALEQKLTVHTVYIIPPLHACAWLPEVQLRRHHSKHCGKEVKCLLLYRKGCRHAVRNFALWMISKVVAESY